MDFLIEANECAGLSEKQIGGKAFNLARMTAKGFPVPHWCVLSRAPRDTADLTRLESWLHAQQAEGHERFIVRSSMAGEDGALASFAGQLVSFPNLTSTAAILRAIEDCIDSGDSERVQAYRSSMGAETGHVAVVVQVMIDADRSGVMFTADPKDGSRRRFLISSTFGACEAVVGGHFDCDEYEVDAGTFATTKRIARKTRALRFSAGEGLREEIISEERQSAETLSDADLRRLVEMGRRLTAWQGRPLDIEWVWEGSRLWLVQMRAIASLGPDLSPQHDFAFDNSNIQESYNGLTLPMTFDFASTAYHRVYRQLMEIMGFDANEVARHDRRHARMLALVKGRVYYNINSWHEGLLLLPSFGRNKADMEHMMGVEEPISFVVDQTLSAREKIARLPAMIALLARMGWAFARIDSRVAAFRRDFQAAYAAFPREELTWMSPQKLFEIFDGLQREVLGHWKAPIINDFFVMMMSGRVRRHLATVNLEHRASDLLAGEELESTKPTRRLVEIADRIRSDARLREAILSGDDDRFAAVLAQRPSVSADLDAYVECYGDRVIGELKLETETLRQNRGFLMRILRSYVADSSLNLAAVEEKQRRTRLAAEKEVFSALERARGRRGLRAFRRDLAKFRKGVAFREAMRLDRTRSFGLFRSLALALGTKMREQGLLDDSRDVFYLTFPEIEGLYHGKSFFDEPRALIAQRKAQYAAWAEIQPPPHLRASMPLRTLPKKPVPAVVGEMKGLGCYPGVVEAEVVVVTDPTAPVSLEGKILIAERTDPGWTPLFLQVKGLIVERGSQLSHSAVVARELGLPTVVGVPGVCQALKTGDRARIDGETGTITRLDFVAKGPEPAATREAEAR